MFYLLIIMCARCDMSMFEQLGVYSKHCALSECTGT